MRGIHRLFLLIVAIDTSRRSVNHCRREGVVMIRPIMVSQGATELLATMLLAVAAGGGDAVPPLLPASSRAATP